MSEVVEHPKTKRCCKCTKHKELDCFPANKNSPDGRKSYCTPCNIRYLQEYRSSDAYRKKDLMRVSEYSKTLRGFAERLLRTAKYRAKEKQLPFDLPKGYFVDLWNTQKGLCAVTGLQMQHLGVGGSVESRCNDYNASPDRIDPKLGYTKDNVRLVCWWVNQMRSDRSDEDFFRLIEILANSPSLQRNATGTPIAA